MQVTKINITDKAKRKIKKIAINNNLDYDLVYSIFCFNWNYDGAEGKWVYDIDQNEDSQNRYKFIFDSLKLPQESLTKNQVVDEIYNHLKKVKKDELYKKFISGAVQGNYCLISEYSSFHYLTNLTKEKLSTLEWKSEKMTNENIVEKLFLKIFRGGSVDRYCLEYLYADLVIDLPYQNQMIRNEDWVENFVKRVDENGEEINLTGLVNILKGFCKGNKNYLQTVLEALSYSDIIKVKNHSVNHIFIPDFRNKLSAHFYSNEWTYPLRFWNESKK